MSHYPTSAELQGFRRDLRDSRTLPDMAWREASFSVPDGLDAAFPHEREYGIGVPWSDWLNDGRNSLYADDISSLSSDARREASAMRSRAFSSVITEGQRAVYHGGSARNACLLERSEGLPVPLDHYHMSGAQLA